MVFEDTTAIIKLIIHL